MIDLSYLTEEEQEMILSVLKRDTDLKRAEEQRVKNLQKQECDKDKLKYLTGEWFYETKSRRHRDRIHGSDIIRASISRRKPVTILELSQMWAERPSFVNSENQDVYVPPELSGLLEEPLAQHKNYYRDDSYNLPEVLQSPTKQRQNPFNSTPLTPETLEETDSQIPNEAMEQTKTPDGEFLPPSEFCVAHLTNLKSICYENIQSAPMHMPVPKKRTIINRSQDSLLESPAARQASSQTGQQPDSPAARQASFPAPRSILKQSTSTDFLQFRNVCSCQPEPQCPQTLHSSNRVLEPSLDPWSAKERETLVWIDRKQVRFSLAVSRSSVEWPTEMQDGKELGEHSLLDLDCTSPPEGEEETGQSDKNGINSGIDQGDHGPLKEDIEVLTAVGSPCWLQQPINDMQRQVDIGEGLSCREKPDIRCLDTGPAQVPADQLDHRHAESLTLQVSNLHCAEQEKGKPILLGAAARGISPTKITEEDGQSMAKVRDWFSWNLGSCDKPQVQLPQQPSDEPETPVDIITDEMPSDAASKKPSSRVSPKPRRRLLGIFSRWEAREEKIPEPQSPLKEEVVLCEQKELDNTTLNFVFCQSTENTYSDQQQDLHKCATDKQSAKNEKTPEVRELVLKKEIDQTQKEPQGSACGVDTLPDKLSNLKSFWEREIGPKILLNKLSNDTMRCEVLVSAGDTCDQKMHDFGKDFAKAETVEASPSFQNIQLHLDTSGTRKSNIFGAKSNDSNDSHMLINHPFSQKVETSEQCNIDLSTALSYDEKSSSSVESSYMLKTSGDNGTFRVKSILISEDNSSSSVGLTVPSQTVQPDEKVHIPLHVSPSSPHTSRQGRVPVPLVRRSLSQQESRKAKINNLKSFWEKENSGPRVIVGKPKEALDSQTHPFSETPPVHHSIATSQSSLRTIETDLGKGDCDKQSSSLYGVKASASDLSMAERIEKGFIKWSSNSSLPSSHCSVGDVDSINQQDSCKMETGPILYQERPLSPKTPLPRSEIPKWKDKTDNELKRSPSKTCHPKALPRGSSSFQGARCDSSPFKSFSKDIASPTREHQNDPERATSVVKQRQGLSHEAMQSGSESTKHTLGITSTSPQFRSEEKGQDRLTFPRRGSAQSSLTSMMSPLSPTRSLPCPFRRTSLGNLSVQEGSPHWSSRPNHGDSHIRRAFEAGKIGQQPINRDPGETKLSGASEVSETHLLLARSFIPQSNQHYLGLPEQTHIPQFISDKVGNDHLSPTVPTPLLLSMTSSEGSPSWISPRSMENVDSHLSRGSMPEIWSQSRASSSCHGENSSPIRLEFKQMSSRPLSRSLEDVLSPPKREERSIIDQRSEMNLNVDDVPPSSLLPLRLPPPSSISVPEQMKNMSKSVSVMQDEKDGRDSDSTSVESLNFSWKKQMGSSLTNLSLSSGMASMSSVSGSVASIYSGVDGDVEVKGTIRFAMNYVQKLGEFHIFVVHCRDLAVAEPKKNRSDPYVKCYLLPDKAKMGKRKASVKKKTLNPTYNEILRFKVTMETLKTQALNVSVWHNDNFGRNSFLGEVDLDLSEWDFSNTQMNDYALKARISTQSLSPSHSQSIDHRGEMRIGLRFLSQISYSKRSSKTETGEVQIWVKDCKNLPAIRGAIIDPFVKCTVLPDTSRKSRQKTRVVKKTANPMFNHTMVYDGFRPDDLREACVEVTVWDYDRLTNHFIGGLRLGLGTGKSYGLEVGWMDSTSEEASLWERMMHSHNEWVEDIIPLRMLIMARGVSK
ncbi:synaptotagmin-like protein 2 isoform X2 [Oncorhynchus masou masou]|uniref:synaptotagmin-like protein 2 isoform X2 n=1 Tax=Oncorhynchus masou masou TaxID=90313 RepID=UPI003183A2DB